MKRILLLLAVIFCCATRLFAQGVVAADSLFIVTYTIGPSWDTSKAFHEQVYSREHSSFLSKMRKDGVAKLGARYADKGIIIFNAPSLAAAKEFIFSDPAVINKLFEPDVQRLNVFYDGCISR